MGNISKGSGIQSKRAIRMDAADYNRNKKL